jgi:hypothetical protein
LAIGQKKPFRVVDDWLKILRNVILVVAMARYDVMLVGESNSKGLNLVPFYDAPGEKTFTRWIRKDLADHFRWTNKIK